MKETEQASQTVDGFSPGFRIGVLDGIILLAGAFFVWYFTSESSDWMARIIGWVVGHFFLFCNVFRISRKLELSWATVFIGLVGIMGVSHESAAILPFAGSAIVTVIVVLIEMKKPSYHGVAWRIINPSLPTWWGAHTSDRAP